MELLIKHLIRTDSTSVNVRMEEQYYVFLGAGKPQASRCPNLRNSNHASFGNALCSQYNFCSHDFCATPALAVERTQKPAETAS